MFIQSDAAYTEVESHAVKVANELEAEYWGVSSKTGKSDGCACHKLKVIITPKCTHNIAIKNR